MALYNGCGEISQEIIKIKAIAQLKLHIPAGYTQRWKVPADSVAGLNSNDWVDVDMLEQSGSLSSQMGTDVKGVYYNNALSWDMYDTSEAAHDTVADLATTGHHFLIYVFGGGRYLLYNEDDLGGCVAGESTTDETALKVSYTIQSRSPVLKIVE